MQERKTKIRIAFRLLQTVFLIILIFIGLSSCGDSPKVKSGNAETAISAIISDSNSLGDEVPVVNSILVSPINPKPGQVFRVLAIGGKNIRKAQIIVSGSNGKVASLKSRNGNGLPFWRIDEFEAESVGKYRVTLTAKEKVVTTLEFDVSAKPALQTTGGIWKSEQGWEARTEALYSAWINALFYDADERSSWTALNEVTQNPERNILFNYLGLNEDDPLAKNRILMEPDCADNPFYLRAYFAWKLGLPFGYHECDRGYLGRAPKTGRWINNESGSSKSNPILAFNSFLRNVMNGVHSGTARTALKDDNSDYYPVALTRESLRPGVVFADPYGHTLIIVRWIPQSDGAPGILLSVDAQPDKTVGIKRFWKGNFLFSTSEVIGDPGFKAFRPITINNGRPTLLKNEEITGESGFIPFSLQQKEMTSDVFYHTMERVINPEPMDPEMALMNLIQALHEQLMVRVTSISNGEAYLKAHPGEVIPMPGGLTGVFQAGGKWEDFSTPNRDLRLLIAMDAVLDFPDRIVRSPEDFKMSRLSSPERVKKNLEEFLSQKLSELSITYIRTNGTEQTLTLAEILKRREAFEMAYNPNDGIEIRWGASENSEERSTCHRQSPVGQLNKMLTVRVWFQKRLHPPT